MKPVLSVLPYQELLGNYNPMPMYSVPGLVLPYQELLGNYNFDDSNVQPKLVLPYQELLGNYNLTMVLRCSL